MTGNAESPALDGGPGPREAPSASAPDSGMHAWAAGSLVLTAVIAAVAKVLGVVVAPGVRGAASTQVVEGSQLLSAVFGYVVTGLLVGLTGVASFEIARSPRLTPGSRFPVVALSGLAIALASPAVVDRLPKPVAVALALVASLLTLIAALAAARSAHTRAVGIVLGLLSFAALFRIASWEVASAAGETASLSTFHVAQVIATFGVLLHAGATLLAGAWLGSRAGWRARVLANAAIVLAFAATWLAGRKSDSASMLELVLRNALGSAVGVPSPFGVGPVAVFLLPACVLLAAVALIERARGPVLLASLALALLAHGSYDVPLQALSAIVAATWTMLASTDVPAASAPRAG